MTTQERDQAVGRAYREKEAASAEARDAQLALIQIGMSLEKLGARLQSVNLTVDLTEDERRSLDAKRIDHTLSDWKDATRRVQQSNAILENR